MKADALDPDSELRALLATLTPKSRDLLRRVLVMDHLERSDVAKELLRFRDEQGNNLADIIDTLEFHPDQRRRAVRLMGEIDAG